jgi:hypothetical protein
MGCGTRGRTKFGGPRAAGKQALRSNVLLRLTHTTHIARAADSEPVSAVDGHIPPRTQATVFMGLHGNHPFMVSGRDPNLQWEFAAGGACRVTGASLVTTARCQRILRLHRRLTRLRPQVQWAGSYVLLASLRSLSDWASCLVGADGCR